MHISIISFIYLQTRQTSYILPVFLDEIEDVLQIVSAHAVDLGIALEFRLH